MCRLSHRALFLTTLLCPIVLSAGCVSEDRYVIQHHDLAQVQQSAQRSELVNAVRASDRKPVRVRVLALQQETIAPHGDGTFQVRARAKNPIITAGSVLTWTGTAISLIGTAIFAIGKVKDDQALFYLGGISALSAEPLMWAGTGLWIYGAMRPPYEVPVSAPPP